MGGSRKKKFFFFGGGWWPLIIWEATTSRTTVSNNWTRLLSSIKQLMHRNYPENLGVLGKIGGGVCPPGPNLEPPLALT